ncbi:hypothetical protein K438DRAFT_891052 [Mycena galopus ATCC 62051]|nr:hypothetical protein K438DRAFT_891052 [Mycena galopus ATCC 62051]
MSPQKLELHFTIGGTGNAEKVTFLENIPALFCQVDAPRELTSRWVGNLVNIHEEGVLAQYPGRCTYCPKQAVALQTTLAITLHGNPPTVLALAQRLCERNRNSPCAIKAEEKTQQGINTFPGGEVYRRG